MNILHPAFKLMTHKKLTVITFHKVPLKKNPLTPTESDLDEFSEIISIVQKTFKFILLEEAINRLKSGKLQENTACLTFDDGYKDWLDGLLPLLDKRKILANFFITTGQINGEPLWNERIINIITKAANNIPSFNRQGVPTISFKSDEEKLKSIKILDENVKYKPISWRSKVLEELELHTGIANPKIRTLTEEDVRLIRAAGHEIGAHTVNHPILRQCSQDEGYREISESKNQLENILGERISGFAYPNGKFNTDFDATHIEMVKRAGFKYGLTSDPGVAVHQSSEFQIPRISLAKHKRFRTEIQLLRNALNPVRNDE